MATILYNKNEKGDIEEVRVQAKKVQGLLASGYVCDPSEFDAVSEETKQDAADAENKAENEKALRSQAKDAGIRNWHNKKLSTLKSELGYDED